MVRQDDGPGVRLDKRETQAILLVLGFMFAGALNVDAFGIVHDLATNNALRNGLIARVDDVYRSRKRLRSRARGVPDRQQA